MVCTMKMMHTMVSEAGRPLRRNYSAELKVQVVGECRRPGASVAGVALSHGINANIVHRWLREHAHGTLVVQTRSFVPIKLEPPVTQSHAPDAEASADIRVEIRKGTNAVVVNWPLSGASSCASCLRDWLN